MRRDGREGVPLSEAEIEAISSRLRNGEYLDDHYRDRLFRQPKEYELTYAGKAPRGSILAETMAVPLQVVRHFGDAADGWRNKLVFGDNLQVLKTLLEMKERGDLRNADGTPGVRLCYIDPPFASRQDFKGRQDEKAYSDKVVGARFIEFLRKRLLLIRELLSDDGTLYVHLDSKKGHYMKVVLDELFGENHFQNEIVWWYYNKMQGNINRFPSNHDSIYVYSLRSAPLFTTLYEEREEVTRLIQRVWDKDKKRLVNAKGPDGKVLYVDRNDKRVDDVWRLSMLQPADKTEPMEYPTQKPKTLLSMILEASSKPGDLVLDAFVGSGTTPVVADELDRRWIAIDSGKFAIYMTQKRLFSNKRGRGRGARTVEPKSFELCAAGLYDNDLLESLPLAEFESFCLELFGCRLGRHTIDGVAMTGTRKGAPVHFFPFDQTDAVMGREYIESLHDRVGGKVSGSLCVVAPTSACDPGLFEDVVQLDNIGYFILRVPYSVIEALHDRRFERLEQASSEKLVNMPLDAYGFDFIEVPEVAITAHWTDEGGMTLIVDSFKRGGLDPDDFPALPDNGRADLAMIMVDRDYDGTVLRISDWQFADMLKAANWSFHVPPRCGSKVMVVLLDRHGNEHRQVFSRTGADEPSRKRRHPPRGPGYEE